MAISERKRLIYTAIVVGLVGIVTGLFLVGNLVPFPPVSLQLYAIKKTTSAEAKVLLAGGAEYTKTTVVIITETTPHGDFHDFAAAMVPNVALAPTAPVPGANEVWALGAQFRPRRLTVPVGTKVTWINKDYQVHTVTSGTDLFDGGLGMGGSFSYTFNKPGVYEYYCKPHRGMAGEITVVGSTNITANQTKE